MTSVRFSIWRDAGYTEGCLERPSKTSSLPSPDFEYELYPSRSELLSRARVKEDYAQLIGCSYVRAIVQTEQGWKVFYGWIDGVTCSSDNPDAPMTIIDWHVDYWRTYLGTASFKSGIVQRRPLLENDTVPPQTYPYRYMEYASSQTLLSPDYWFVVFTYTHNRTSGETTIAETCWGCYPVSKNDPYKKFKIKNGGNAPSLDETFGGSFDEILGLDPESVGGVWVSPIPPARFTYSDDGCTMQSWSALSGYAETNCFTAVSINSFHYSESIPLNAGIMTDDEHVMTVTGFQGEAIGTLPWGIEVGYLRVTLVASVESCYLRLRFQRYQTESLNSSSAMGLVFTYPCVNVGLTSNAWSSYVYSGARETEREQRRLQTEQTKDLGLSSLGASLGGSVIEGATAGAMMGAVGGPVGSAVGAGVGALTSAIGTATTALKVSGEYAVNQTYNDKFNRLSDYSHAVQTNTNILPAGSFEPFTTGISGLNIVETTKDSYSLSQRETDIAMYGVTVSEPTESCQSLIDAGGPIQITNLTVGGPIPPQAKTYFRDAFRGGVRIV